MTDQSELKGKHRLFPIDALRGLLIILMALDHANFFIAKQHSTGEYWGGYFPVFNSQLAFLTRFVTHLCAPGFFFLMGAGMVLFQSSRKRKGWSDGEIRRHFLIRGSVLVAVQLFLNFNQIWATSGWENPILYMGVLAALGVGMICCIPLLKLKPVTLVFIAAAFFIIMEVITPQPDMWGRNFDQIAGVLLVYGGGEGILWVNYPLLAWVELVICGLIFGQMLLKYDAKTYRWGSWVGFASLIGFVLLRWGNEFGTIRPLTHDSWTGFLSVVKYPPSLVYVLLTMGINLILLWVLSFWKGKGSSRWNPLLVFGRAPLFSYVVHIGIFLLLGRFLFPAGTSLEVMYLVWVGGLMIMYLPALWYGSFKNVQPSSSWLRFF